MKNNLFFIKINLWISILIELYLIYYVCQDITYSYHQDTVDIPKYNVIKSDNHNNLTVKNSSITTIELNGYLSRNNTNTSIRLLTYSILPLKNDKSSIFIKKYPVKYSIPSPSFKKEGNITKFSLNQTRNLSINILNHSLETNHMEIVRYYKDDLCLKNSFRYYFSILSYQIYLIILFL